jgi:hypothetical protein
MILMTRGGEWNRHLLLCFPQVSQSFYKYPTPEYNWNYLDELICGYVGDLRPETKYRRKLYAICPEECKTPEDGPGYVSRVG